VIAGRCGKDMGCYDGGGDVQDQAAGDGDPWQVGPGDRDQTGGKDAVMGEGGAGRFGAKGERGDAAEDEVDVEVEKGLGGRGTGGGIGVWESVMGEELGCDC
jgi:hypothetical protein